MRGILMSSVISDVLTVLLDELREGIVPNRIFVERLFNRAHQEIVTQLENFKFNLRTTITKQTSESVTATANTDTRTIYASGSAFTDDEHNGWLAKNSTSKGEAFITDTVETGSVLYLSHAIAGQASGDAITIERLAKWVDLPWYVIRPYEHDGVHWGGNNQRLDPISLPEMQDLYRSNSAPVGTPCKYAIENQRLWIYPQPTSTDILKISGYRRPADCMDIATTSNGSSRGDTIISTNFPTREDDHYQGTDVLIKSGTYAGEVRTIDEYDQANKTAYFESPFSGQIDSGVEIELLSAFTEEYRGLMEDYLKWNLYRRHKEFRNEASYYEAEYRNRLNELIQVHRRKTTSNANLGRSGRFRTNRPIVQVSS